MIEDAFSKYYKKRKSRINNLFPNRNLNHSNSQRLIGNDNNHNLKRNYFLRNNFENGSKSLLLPRINNSFRKENVNNRYKNNINSSFRQNDIGPFRNSRFGIFKNNGSNSFVDAPKRISGYLDYKINMALANKKMREELEKKRIISSMKKSINEEFKKNRPVDDKYFLRELNEIDGYRKDMKLFREQMLNELKEEETDLSDYSSLDMPPIPPPPIIPPLYPYPNIFPQMMIPPPPPPPPNYNNENDSMGELIKFMLVKKLLDSDVNPLFKMPLNFFPFFPYSNFPPFYQINFPRKRPFPYPKPIIIERVPYRSNRDYRSKKRSSSDSLKGKSFRDPLDNYLDVIERFKKLKEDDSKKEKEKGSSKDESDEESDEEEGEEEEEDDEKDDDKGDKDGEENEKENEKGENEGDDNEGEENGGEENGGEENGGEQGDEQKNGGDE